MTNVDQNADMGGDSLPGGTVTFLLTDVERSTLLWAERPAEMPAALARHEEILSAEISHHDGSRPLEQGEGDSIVAAFARASDAVSAALAAQISLQQTLPWLRVRMALHTGEAARAQEGRYSGPAIIRGARLRAAAHGGQVLLSATTAALADGTLPAGARLEDLGRVHLRDLDLPERVHQLVHPHLEASFPPLRGLVDPPVRLPADMSALVGRVGERQELVGLVTTHRLVVVTGAGGAGKTRLALAAARDVSADRYGGTWWVELAPLTAGDDVARAVAAALGTSVPGTEGPLASTIAYLRAAGPTLLVLDNAEHLSRPVAELSELLLAACPDLGLMVTSREPLGLPGEVVWRIPSLGLPPEGATTVAELTEHDAAQLFLARARASRPHLVIDDLAARAIGEICRRLDGLPLALELAAARARTMSLERLAAALDDTFRLLTGGARTALPRQQTLEASIAWSVDLLDPAERAVLRRLAVLQTPFSADAAEAIAADGVEVDTYDVFDALGRLVDKSLVLLDDDGHYRMLETVRRFGLDRLRDAHELASTRGRHAVWFAEWAERCARGRYGLDRSRFRRHAMDVAAAMEWACASDPMTVFRFCRAGFPVGDSLGLEREHRLTDWLLAHPPDDHPSDWAAALACQSVRSLTIDRWDMVERLPDVIARLAPDDDLSRSHLEVEATMGEAIMGETSTWHAASTLWDRSGLVLNVMGLSGPLAMIDNRSGQRAAARRVVDDVHARVRATGAPFSIETAGFAYIASLDLEITSGRLDEARSHVVVGDGDVDVQMAAAVSHAHLGWLTKDDDLVASALRWADRPGGPREVPLAHLVRAYGARHAGDAAGTADEFVTALPGLWITGLLVAWHPADAVVALLAARRRPEAIDVLDRARAVASAGRAGNLLTVTADLAGAVLALHDGALDHAVALAHEGLDGAVRAETDLFVVDALGVLAVATERRGQRRTAARLAGATTAARERMGYRRPFGCDAIGTDAFDGQLSLEEPASYAEGRQFTLEAAVSFARRARGERGRAAFGPESLTPTERLVCAAVAAGRTNGQIASELAMSVATVKTHLTHIFAKVGVANRTALALHWSGRDESASPR